VRYTFHRKHNDIVYWWQEFYNYDKGMSLKRGRNQFNILKHEREIKNWKKKSQKKTNKHWLNINLGCSEQILEVVSDYQTDSNHLWISHTNLFFISNRNYIMFVLDSTHFSDRCPLNVLHYMSWFSCHFNDFITDIFCMLVFQIVICWLQIKSLALLKLVSL